jgi:hypothetical protein
MLNDISCIFLLSVSFQLYITRLLAKDKGKRQRYFPHICFSGQSFVGANLCVRPFLGIEGYIPAYQQTGSGQRHIGLPYGGDNPMKKIGRDNVCIILYKWKFMQYFHPPFLNLLVEDSGLIDAPNHDAVHCAGDVEAGLSGHDGVIESLPACQRPLRIYDPAQSACYAESVYSSDWA